MTKYGLKADALLLFNNGFTSKEVSEKLGLSQKTAGEWRQYFDGLGLITFGLKLNYENSIAVLNNRLSKMLQNPESSIVEIEKLIRSIQTLTNINNNK